LHPEVIVDATNLVNEIYLSNKRDFMHKIFNLRCW